MQVNRSQSMDEVPYLLPGLDSLSNSKAIRHRRVLSSLLETYTGSGVEVESVEGDSDASRGGSAVKPFGASNPRGAPDGGGVQEVEASAASLPSMSCVAVAE